MHNVQNIRVDITPVHHYFKAVYRSYEAGDLSVVWTSPIIYGAKEPDTINFPAAKYQLR